jgi:membrane protein
MADTAAAEVHGLGLRPAFWLAWLQVALVLLMAASLVPVFFPGFARAAFAWLVYADLNRLAAFPPEAVRYATFLHAVLGAVMFGWAVLLFLIVRGPLAAGSRRSWRAVMASLVAWFVPGTLFSIASGVWQNVVLNLLFMAAYAAPLAATYPSQMGAGAMLPRRPCARIAMTEPAHRLLGRIETTFWGPRGEDLPPWKLRALRLGRTALVLAKDLARGELTLRAMSLVYTTLLSLVPLLALAFSVLKAFGVSTQMQPILLTFLAPLGENGRELAQRIVGFIDNMNVGVLGALGLGFLLYTAVSLVQKIEEALNFIWHIHRPRPMAERFTRYLSVLTVGPILVFSALGITATLMNMETVRYLLAIGPLEQTVQVLSRLAPYLLVIAAFTFVYTFIPNARVRIGCALIGGVAGGIAWQTAGWAFALFVASSSQYSAIYSGFAIVLLFMIWLYVSWMILLFGASVAFYAQHPEYLYATGGEPRLSNRMRERLALSVMSLVVRDFGSGRRATSKPELARRLGMPMHTLQVVLDALESEGLVVCSAGEPPKYLPARDPASVRLIEVLESVRAAGEKRFLSPAHLPVPEIVDTVLEQVRQATDAAIGHLTLADLGAGGTRKRELADAPAASGLERRGLPAQSAHETA